MSDRIRRWWAAALPVATTVAAFALAVVPLMRRW
jgi:hypothetical protein